MIRAAQVPSTMKTKPQQGLLLMATLLALCWVLIPVQAGAVFEETLPIFTNASNYLVSFSPVTPPNNPATIKAGHSPFDQYTLQMRDVTIEPCGVIAMHIHPRGTEQGYVIKGAIEFGMFLENGTVVYATPKEGQGIIVPQGTVHYARNVVCETSHIVVVFDNPNPAVVYVGQSLVAFPKAVLDSAFVGKFPSATKGNQFFLEKPYCNCPKGH